MEKISIEQGKSLEAILLLVSQHFTEINAYCMQLEDRLKASTEIAMMQQQQIMELKLRVEWLENKASE